MGAFGLLDRPQDDLVPGERLVEAHPVADVFELYRQGLLTPGTEAQVEDPNGHGGYLVSTRDARKIELDHQPIGLVPHKALPLYAFSCPLCRRDCYRVTKVGDTWLCRKCHRLDYSSRHRNRTVGGGRLNRVKWLRRRIGADPTPFTQLPMKPLSARRHWRLVHEIRALEGELLEHTRDAVISVLEKRYDRS